MKYYVVSDIHGFYTALTGALEEAGFFADTEPHMLIVCGDVFDRGNEAKAVLDFLLELMEKDQLIYILGNHEELLIRCMQELSRGADPVRIATGVHALNGTWDTLLQIGEADESFAVGHPLELVERVMASPLYQKLLTVCVDYYETQKYVFCHGWIPCFTREKDKAEVFIYNPEWRDASADEWKKARWRNGMELACGSGVVERGKTIVCGHWHTSYGHSVFEKKGSEWGEDADFSPFCGDGIIAIDGCTAYSGIINCLVIEDSEDA